MPPDNPVEEPKVPQVPFRTFSPIAPAPLPSVFPRVTITKTSSGFLPPTQQFTTEPARLKVSSCSSEGANAPILHSENLFASHEIVVSPATSPFSVSPSCSDTLTSSIVTQQHSEVAPPSTTVDLTVKDRNKCIKQRTDILHFRLFQWRKRIAKRLRVLSVVKNLHKLANTPPRYSSVLSQIQIEQAIM